MALVGIASLACLLGTVGTRRWPAVDASRATGAAVREAATHPGALRSFLRARTDPGAATGLGLTLALVGITLGGLLLGLLTFLVRASDTGLIEVDRGAAQWGSQNATSLSTTIVRSITHLGATVTIVVLGLSLCALVRRRLPARSIFLYLLIVVGGQVIIVNLIKFAVARARPDIDPLAIATGASFPSGHTTAAAAFYAAVALVLGRGRSSRQRSMLVGAAVAIAVAVGATRVLLGVHWLSDVVGGLALGWSWFAICSLTFGGRLLRFGAPVEAAMRAADAEPRGPTSVSDPARGGYPAPKSGAADMGGAP